MTTSSQVETVSTGADKAKLAVSVLLLVGAVVAFYMLGKQDLWLRVVALLVLLGAAIFTLFAVFEKRRNDVLSLLKKLREWE